MYHMIIITCAAVSRHVPYDHRSVALLVGMYHMIIAICDTVSRTLSAWHATLFPRFCQSDLNLQKMVVMVVVVVVLL